MQCPDCGAFVTADDSFCGECGRPLSSRSLPAEPLSPLQAKDLPTVELEKPPQASSSPPEIPLPRKKLPIVPILLVVGIVLLLVCVCGAGIYAWLSSDDNPLQALATPRVPLYEDDFGDPSSGWDVFNEDDTLAEYANGEYRLGVYQSNYMAWGNPASSQEFADFQVEVDARQAQGSLDNNFGLLIRYQADSESFYWFEISGDGYYSVDLRQAGQWSTLVSWAASDAISQGIGAINHLKVICAGNRFMFYVNDTLLTEMSDSTFNSGTIGLAVGTFDEPGVVVYFDNVKVYPLQD